MNPLQTTPEGLTLRDYFAVKAMVERLDIVSNRYLSCKNSLQKIAFHSYKLADAMMEARSEK
jgi:hypothetical protein